MSGDAPPMIRRVAPLAGAWIETIANGDAPTCAVSRPSRARGLKLAIFAETAYLLVAPLAGAWIETRDGSHTMLNRTVAPLAGAWIETSRSNR